MSYMQSDTTQDLESPAFWTLTYQIIWYFYSNMVYLYQYVEVCRDKKIKLGNVVTHNILWFTFIFRLSPTFVISDLLNGLEGKWMDN